MVVAELFAKLGLMPDKKSFDDGHDLIQRLGNGLKLLGIGLALHEIGEMVGSVVELGGKLNDLSQSTGISTDALQELGYAAKINGSSMEGAVAGLKKFAKGMEDVAKGKGPVVDALKSMHINAKEFKGESLDKNLEVIADKFSTMPDGAHKAALAMKLFGRAGVDLIPLLNLGAAGVAKLRNEAHELGVVIDEESVHGLDDVGDDMDRLKAGLQGLKNQFVVALLPVLKEAVAGLVEWFKANREIIASTLKSALENIVAAFRMLFTVVGFVVGLFQKYEPLFYALIVLVGAYAAASILAAAQTAAAWIIAQLPLIATVAIVAGVLLGVKKLVEYVAGRKVTWSEFFEAAKRAGEAFLSWMAALPGRVATWVADVASSIKQAFADAWSSVVQGAHDAWNEIKDTPIVGHIIRGGIAVGEFAVDTFGGGGDAAPAVSAAPGGGSSTSVQNTFGDTNVVINGSNLSTDELKSAVKGAVQEHSQDQIREAHAALTGGRR